MKIDTPTFLASVVCTATIFGLAVGPLDPPSGPVAPTGPSLTELEQAIERVEDNLETRDKPSGTGNFGVQARDWAHAFDSETGTWYSIEPSENFDVTVLVSPFGDVAHVYSRSVYVWGSITKDWSTIQVGDAIDEFNIRRSQGNFFFTTTDVSGDDLYVWDHETQQWYTTSTNRGILDDSVRGSRGSFIAETFEGVYVWSADTKQWSFLSEDGVRRQRGVDFFVKEQPFVK